MITKEVKKFLKDNNIQYEIIDEQVHINGSLDLRSLTSIPDGFNPTVGGWLDLRSLEPVLRNKVKVNKPKENVYNKVQQQITPLLC